jgi:asparagine synthase (glutamine-hydrolysing)
MCGIAGLFRPRGIAPEDAAVVNRVMAAQVHRGPDGEGLYCGNRAVLGHRRLSILDLSDAGRQPMSNEDGFVWVVFNGEIYNYIELRDDLMASGHRFRSNSDTEVLLHGYEEWGIERLLAKLRGMFAFGLYDARRSLILARDRLGIKPLYYFSADNLVLFASEVKALLRSGVVPDEQDRKALAGFLIAGSIPSPRTIVKSVSCLPPGHWAECKDGQFSVRKYWDLDCSAEPTSSADADLQGCLKDTVNRHLISDVPLGVFLSGGVDSAGLVALASRIRMTQGNRLHTLTVVFDERDHSEADTAAEAARRFETHHQEVRVTCADFQRELPAFFRSMDQPTNDGINSYFVSQAARRTGLTVVLSGLGGDEVFWGYRHYPLLARAGWLVQSPWPLRRLLAYSGCRWGRLRSRDSWMRTAYLSGSGSIDRLYLTMRGFFAPEQAKRLLDMSRAELEAIIEEQFNFCPVPRSAPAMAFNYLEIKRYLHDQLLRDMDVFGMAHSIEARVPYLDHVLVERMWGLASELKLDSGVNKPLLVRAVDDPLLLTFASRRKRGFIFPMSRWMQSCRSELQEIAASASLDRRTVRECWTQFARGQLHWSRAWALAVLGSER